MILQIIRALPPVEGRSDRIDKLAGVGCDRLHRSCTRQGQALQDWFLMDGSQSTVRRKDLIWIMFENRLAASKTDPKSEIMGCVRHALAAAEGCQTARTLRRTLPIASKDLKKLATTVGIARSNVTFSNEKMGHFSLQKDYAIIRLQIQCRDATGRSIWLPVDQPLCRPYI